MRRLAVLDGLVFHASVCRLLAGDVEYVSEFGCSSGRLALLLLLLLLLGGDAGGHGRAAVAGAAPHEPISASTWSFET